MSVYNGLFGHGVVNNQIVDSPYDQQLDVGVNSKPPTPPVTGNFLLLDGTDFLLLDSTDFLLL